MAVARGIKDNIKYQGAETTKPLVLSKPIEESRTEEKLILPEVSKNQHQKEITQLDQLGTFGRLKKYTLDVVKDSAYKTAEFVTLATISLVTIPNLIIDYSKGRERQVELILKAKNYFDKQAPEKSIISGNFGESIFDPLKAGLSVGMCVTTAVLGVATGLISFTREEGTRLILSTLNGKQLSYSEFREAEDKSYYLRLLRDAFGLGVFGISLIITVGRGGNLKSCKSIAEEGSRVAEKLAKIPSLKWLAHFFIKANKGKLYLDKNPALTMTITSFGMSGAASVGEELISCNQLSDFNLERVRSNTIQGASYSGIFMAGMKLTGAGYVYTKSGISLNQIAKTEGLEKLGAESLQKFSTASLKWNAARGFIDSGDGGLDLIDVIEERKRIFDKENQSTFTTIRRSIGWFLKFGSAAYDMKDTGQVFGDFGAKKAQDAASSISLKESEQAQPKQEAKLTTEPENLLSDFIACVLDPEQGISKVTELSRFRYLNFNQRESIGTQAYKELCLMGQIEQALEVQKWGICQWQKIHKLNEQILLTLILQGKIESAQAFFHNDSIRFFDFGEILQEVKAACNQRKQILHKEGGDWKRVDDLYRKIRFEITTHNFGVDINTKKPLTTTADFGIIVPQVVTKEESWANIDFVLIERNFRTIVTNENRIFFLENQFRAGSFGQILSTPTSDIYYILSQLSMPTYAKEVTLVDLGSAEGHFLIRAAMALGAMYPQIQFSLVGLEGNSHSYEESSLSLDNAVRANLIPKNVNIIFVQGDYQQTAEKILPQADLIYCFDFGFYKEGDEIVSAAEISAQTIAAYINYNASIIEPYSRNLARALKELRIPFQEDRHPHPNNNRYSIFQTYRPGFFSSERSVAKAEIKKKFNAESQSVLSEFPMYSAEQAKQNFTKAIREEIIEAAFAGNGYKLAQHYFHLYMFGGNDGFLESDELIAAIELGRETINPSAQYNLTFFDLIYDLVIFRKNDKYKFNFSSINDHRLKALVAAIYILGENEPLDITQTQSNILGKITNLYEKYGLQLDASAINSSLLVIIQGYYGIFEILKQVEAFAIVPREVIEKLQARTIKTFTDYIQQLENLYKELEYLSTLITAEDLREKQSIQDRIIELCNQLTACLILIEPNLAENQMTAINVRSLLENFSGNDPIKAQAISGGNDLLIYCQPNLARICLERIIADATQQVFGNDTSVELSLIEDGQTVQIDISYPGKLKDGETKTKFYFNLGEQKSFEQITLAFAQMGIWAIGGQFKLVNDEASGRVFTQISFPRIIPQAHDYTRLFSQKLDNRLFDEFLSCVLDPARGVETAERDIKIARLSEEDKRAFAYLAYQFLCESGELATAIKVAKWAACDPNEIAIWNQDILLFHIAAGRVKLARQLYQSPDIRFSDLKAVADDLNVALLSCAQIITDETIDQFNQLKEGLAAEVAKDFDQLSKLDQLSRELLPQIVVLRLNSRRWVSQLSSPLRQYGIWQLSSKQAAFEKYLLILEILEHLGILGENKHVLYPAQGDDIFPGYFANVFGLNTNSLSHNIGGSINTLDRKLNQFRERFRWKNSQNHPSTKNHYRNVFDLGSYWNQLYQETDGQGLDVLYLKGFSLWAYYPGILTEAEVKQDLVQPWLKFVSDHLLKANGCVVLASSRDHDLAEYLITELGYRDVLDHSLFPANLKAELATERDLDGNNPYDNANFYNGGLQVILGHVGVRILRKPNVAPNIAGADAVIKQQIKSDVENYYHSWMQVRETASANVSKHNALKTQEVEVSLLEKIKLFYRQRLCFHARYGSYTNPKNELGSIAGLAKLILPIYGDASQLSTFLLVKSEEDIFKHDQLAQAAFWSVQDGVELINTEHKYIFANSEHWSKWFRFSNPREISFSTKPVIIKRGDSLLLCVNDPDRNKKTAIVNFAHTIYIPNEVLADERYSLANPDVINSLAISLFEYCGFKFNSSHFLSDPTASLKLSDLDFLVIEVSTEELAAMKQRIGRPFETIQLMMMPISVIEHMLSVSENITAQCIRDYFRKLSRGTD